MVRTQHRHTHMQHTHIQAVHCHRAHTKTHQTHTPHTPHTHSTYTQAQHTSHTHVTHHTPTTHTGTTRIHKPHTLCAYITHARKRTSHTYTQHTFTHTCSTHTTRFAPLCCVVLDSCALCCMLCVSLCVRALCECALRMWVCCDVRRGLEHRFPRSTPGETRARFARRMAKVQAYMNSPEFEERDGGGLAALAESLRARCQRVSLLRGVRFRT